MVKPRARTIARSRLTRARRENFCHMSLVRELVCPGEKSPCLRAKFPFEASVDRQKQRRSNRSYNNVAHVARPPETDIATVPASNLTRRADPVGVVAGSNAVRVLIVDDHRIVASGCRALFADDPEIEILEAADAESGERAFEQEHPDVCVLDINLPTVSGYELARRILGCDASARIIMFSMNDDPVFAARAIEVGAKGYVSKSGEPQDLVDAIREVGSGGT